MSADSLRLTRRVPKSSRTGAHTGPDEKVNGPGVWVEGLHTISYTPMQLCIWHLRSAKGEKPGLKLTLEATQASGTMDRTQAGIPSPCTVTLRVATVQIRLGVLCLRGG